ncbi:hypothetical protein WJX82_004419 [Trebouxia sp. C0006]
MATLLKIDGCEVTPGPDFDITVIAVRMIASPRPACWEHKVANRRSPITPCATAGRGGANTLPLRGTLLSLAGTCSK